MGGSSDQLCMCVCVYLGLQDVQKVWKLVQICLSGFLHASKTVCPEQVLLLVKSERNSGLNHATEEVWFPLACNMEERWSATSFCFVSQGLEAVGKWAVRFPTRKEQGLV